MHHSNMSAVTVKGVTKTFRIPLEGNSGVKQKLINYFKGRSGYRNFTPLNDISFEIKKGEFFGIVGRNGSGKSTLLKTIAGIYTPNNGAVHVAGTLVPFIELGVGFNPELTGRENVFLNGALLGFSHTQMEEMYESIVDFAELHDFMEERLKNYSSGMQVRLAFSIAIRAEGDILLLDEVLAVGDEAFQQKCMNYFEELKSNKKTVILVTHDMAAVKRFCSRALVLTGGKIEAIGTPSDIADIYTKENIEATQSSLDKEASEDGSVTASIIQEDDIKRSDSVDIKINYPSQNVDHFVGISIQQDGVAVGELNSKQEIFTSDNTSVTLRLNTVNLNPGSYFIGAAVFNRKTNALLGFNNKAVSIFINGTDDNRGGALRVDGQWVYEK